ncbi:MAG TPA: molybdopterin-guanine dinucleotide biosynthesis protein B [Thermoanaerobaculia bacterium]
MSGVRPGIDNLIADPFLIAGRRFGLVTNPSGVASDGTPSWRALSRIGGATLARLFGPEHGVDGGAVYMEAVRSAVHPPTGLPCISLYGTSVESLKPRSEDLEGLDALVFDIQDVGARYYTYAWTMLLAMEACAEKGIRFVVCDRVNPIGGAVEGAPQEADHLSFVGLHAVPVRHGMTLGELAKLLAAERKLAVDLAVAPVSGWTRDMPFEKTGLTWVSPSPNIPSTATALLYPGMCLVEGTNLSEGRGTTRPFELIGAPWLDASRFADALSSLGLPGLRAVPIHFRPMFDKHAGATCGGVLLTVTDPRRFRSFETGLRLIDIARRLAPGDFRWRAEPYEFDSRPAIDLLTGSVRFRRLLESEADIGLAIAGHDEGARGFLARREPFLLYPDRKPAAVAFVGSHNSGKTTLVLDLVPRLQAMGLSVGVIKHTSKDVEDDVVGKDSHRHSLSGAAASVLVTPARTTARRRGPEEELQALLEREFSSCDLVLVEGYKTLPIPKIEVRRSGVAAVAVDGALARISDVAAADGLPTVRFDHPDAIAALVLRLAGLDRIQRRGA